MREENRSDWVLKAMLNHCPEDRRTVLYNYLPETEKTRLHAMPFFMADLNAEEAPLFDYIHWSWFLPHLKAYTPKERQLFLYALPEHYQTSLANELGVVLASSHALPSLCKTFLQQTLLHSVTGASPSVLDISFLPPSPLHPLLHLTKKELIKLIDILSFYDLAAELRQIVETKILKKIYSFLSEKEKKLLKKIAATKEPYAAMRLKLDQGEYDTYTFRHILHKRGLTRLGVALSTQHPDFCWYLCHHLDIGRGTALIKLSSVAIAPDVSESIIRQVLTILTEKELLA